MPTMSAPEAAIAVVVVTAAMVGLSLAWMEFKKRRQAKRSAPTPAPEKEYATGTLATRTD